MWIKICGNTRLEDCLLAAELGADAVGFVFAPGKRTVTVVQVAEIIARLPQSLEKIGVFTSRDAHVIASSATEAGLTGIQLHGEYDAQLARELRERLGTHPGTHRGTTGLIQVVHWEVDEPAAGQAEVLADRSSFIARDGGVRALLIDSRTRQASGGTGRSFDWQAATSVFAASAVPMIAAGGLTAGNVGEAIRTLRPWGVDSSSGVEIAPGQKDPKRLRAFIRNARAAS